MGGEIGSDFFFKKLFRSRVFLARVINKKPLANHETNAAMDKYHLLFLLSKKHLVINDTS